MKQLSVSSEEQGQPESGKTDGEDRHKAGHRRMCQCDRGEGLLGGRNDPEQQGKSTRHS